MSETQERNATSPRKLTEHQRNGPGLWLGEQFYALAGLGDEPGFEGSNASIYSESLRLTKRLASSHKRSKSAALSLLRRNQSRTDLDTGSDAGSISKTSLASHQTTSSTQSQGIMSGPPSHTPSLGHRPQLSTSTIGFSSPNLQVSPKTGKAGSPAQDKTLSIEQSVRKFRVFEALRSGDTASISKAIKDTAEGGLEDTTILHLAIQCAEMPVAEYVLSEGATIIDVNAKDKDGNTPLHIAASQGRGHMVRLLLEQDGINDSIPNYQGRLPLDLARTPDIFQQLQLSRSLFADSKVKEIQTLIARGEYKLLGEVLEEPRVKTVLDINGGEFTSDITTVQSGGTLLHEAARKKDKELIQVLLLHGADPFRRDRRGKLPQDVTKDDLTRAMLKRSPAAVAAQRGIQEKAVLGNANSQGAMASAPGDALAGKESREMKGYLKKWTNYRKGYQLRWFVLEDGVLSYYKHQDDAGSACRGAINMRIAKLSMDPTEKQKFEIHGKSSVKYSLKANHEVEAKRWFWALNNSIQWTKDQAKEEERQKAENAEYLRQAKAQHAGKAPSKDASTADLGVEGPPEGRRNSQQSSRLGPQSGLGKSASQRVAFQGASNNGSVADEEDGYGSYEPSFAGEVVRTQSHMSATNLEGEDDEEEFGDEASSRDMPASKDAFDITAQSARLQLDLLSQVNAAIQLEQSKNPTLVISDKSIVQAVSTYDGSIKSLDGLLGDLLRISKDRDAYWQHRLDREADMRRIWEDSMAQVAREQEVLEAKVGESEQKRKRTKRALREVIEGTSRPETPALVDDGSFNEAVDAVPFTADNAALRRKSIAGGSLRRKSIMAEVTGISDSDSGDDDEFFDAVDAGEIKAAPMPPTSPALPPEVVEKKGKEVVLVKGVDISPSFHGYEGGIRKRLKLAADDRPKISLWGILKSMIGKDMTKMALPVSFNEPTSFLQRCAEDMEYADLLDLAADRLDSAERLVYVAAFATSYNASTIARVAKPFNPLLGETFEYARPDKNYRFFIEQVSHHPPIGASWAESPKWTYYGELNAKSKFYGKSFDVFQLGTWFLWLRPTNGDKEELYTWKKVTSSVTGIITGNPTVDNYGLLEIKNWMTGEVALLDFKPRGWTSGSAYQVSGRVNDARGQPRYSIGGKWSNKLYARLTPGYEAAVEEPKKGTIHRHGSISDPHQPFVVWEVNPRPTGIPFNLTPFAVTLNALTDELRPWLPPTDTRLRPDQRAMEDGLYDLAASEKHRVEEKQRKARREREAKGEEFVPVWFQRRKDAITGEEYWHYTGKYWHEREKAGLGQGGKWKGVPDIF